MKPSIKPLRLIKLAVSVFGALLFLSTSGFAVNIISGTIFDKARQPLADIDIELLDEYQRLVPNGRQRTQSSGRYEFGVNNSGRYFIRVYAFQYDLVDETREVNVASVSMPGQGPGSSYNLEDFYLQPKKGGLRDAELSVIFAQDIPKDAKAAYDDGVEKLNKKQFADGFAQIKKSIEIFPKYFNALSRYGTELFIKKQYQEAAAMFFRAADVNPKSATSYYFLAYSMDSMSSEYKKAARVAALEALKLAPASSGVNLLVGRIERKLGDYSASEKHLLQAKRFANSPVPQIHMELSQLYSNNLKKYKEAADELESFIKSSKITGEEETKMRSMVAGLREKAKSQTTN